MHQDSVQLHLESVESYRDYTPKVSLTVSAYFTEGDIFDKNTIEFHCGPMGSNYDTTYLRVVLDDWSKVADIRDFLAHHFSDSVMQRQTMTVDIADGVFELLPVDGSGHKKEGLSEFTVTADGERIKFGGMAAMTPYFYTYEKLEDEDEADSTNADKILSFFDEIIDLHPSFEIDKQESPDTDILFDWHSIEGQLEAIAGSDSSLLTDYQKAVREYEDQEFEDSIRDVGRAAETLIELLCETIYDESEIPSNTGGCLNKLDKTEEGIHAMVGKSISPLWWLRNRVNHPSEYEVTKDDAHYALLCFQVASEKYAEVVLNEEG